MKIALGKSARQVLRTALKIFMESIHKYSLLFDDISSVSSVAGVTNLSQFTFFCELNA